jgi:hypothetical protein
VDSSLRETQKQLVRTLVLQHGQKKASELSEVPYETVRKWTQRYHWLRPNHDVPNVPSPAKTVADNVANEMQELKRKTKLSLARYSAKASKDAESATLRDAPLVHKVAQVASLTWPEEQKANSILNLGILIGSEERERVIEARNLDSEGQDSGD